MGEDRSTLTLTKINLVSTSQISKRSMDMHRELIRADTLRLPLEDIIT